MKHLPCDYCKGPASVKTGRHEEPLVVGRIGHFPYRYKCSKCLRVTTLSIQAYNKLPELSPEELKQLGVVLK